MFPAISSLRPQPLLFPRRQHPRGWLNFPIQIVRRAKAGVLPIVPFDSQQNVMKQWGQKKKDQDSEFAFLGSSGLSMSTWPGWKELLFFKVLCSDYLLGLVYVFFTFSQLNMYCKMCV